LRGEAVLSADESLVPFLACSNMLRQIEKAFHNRTERTWIADFAGPDRVSNISHRSKTSLRFTPSFDSTLSRDTIPRVRMTAGDPVTRVHVAFAATLIGLLLLATASVVHAERLPIKTYTAVDGLPCDHIKRILQDSRGFLWFCTSEGLSRFDGYRFNNYGTEQGLADRQVVDFLEARDGTYWVATAKGLCRLITQPLKRNETSDAPSPPTKFATYYPGSDPKARYISAIYQDHSGTIWCGTKAGVFRIDQIGGDWVFSLVNVSPVESGERLDVRAIIEDRQGSLWIGAETGLYRRRPDGVSERYSSEEGLPRFGGARVLLEDREGRIWAAISSGLCELVPDPKPRQPVVKHLYTEKDGLAGHLIETLCETADGRLWVGTTMGLSEFLPAKNKKDDGKFKSYTTANGLSDKEIWALASDRDQNLWIGTPYGGAMRIAPSGLTTYNRADGLGGVGINSIFEDQDGELIVVDSDSHLNRFDGRKFSDVRISLPKGMSYRGWGWYQSVIQDRSGEWWVPAGEGLIRYPRLGSPDQIASARPKAIYTIRDGLPDNDMFRLFEDSHGDIWVSTVGNSDYAFTRWERATETFHRLASVDGMPKGAPTAFCEDASGNLWIGFYSGGLLRYSAGRFTAFASADGLPAGFVGGLYLDRSGRLWVATAEGGVARADNPNGEHPIFVTYSTADGLSSNQATCVTEDQFGMIYIGTGRGVDKLDPANGHIKHYTTADGLASSFINVGFRGSDGSLWFGTLQGLSRLIPQPEPRTSPPPIIISALSIAGVPFAVSELGAINIAGPEIGPNQNHIQIDFVGLSLGVGETLRYQFKLEGGHGDWSPLTDQRSVNYPNLPAGTYRYLVRAVSADGTLSETPASVTFRVLPAIWQRWWFMLLAVSLIALPIIAVARYRRQRMRAIEEAEEALRSSREERLVELEQVRRRIATDLHDDIGSSLSQIYLLSEVVRQRVGRGDAEVIEPLTIISSASHEMVSSMSDIVWAINPKKDHLSDLIHRMRRFASDTFATRDIAFRFIAPDDEADIRLGANIRREVFLIFKESVNNLVKHSGCSEAEIKFQLADGSLLLTVSDNGKGFDSSLDSEGHGLVSMCERANSIGGRFELVSNESRGTTITLCLPLPQAGAPLITN
jgi:ligand-binding sensor domain-containing protein/signal transduction histidine kinase